MNSFHNFIIKKLNFIFKVKTTCGYYFSIVLTYCSLVVLGFYIAGVINLSNKITVKYFLKDLFEQKPSLIFNDLNFLESFAYIISSSVIILIIVSFIFCFVAFLIYFLSEFLPNCLKKIKEKFCRELTEEELSKINK